MKNARVKRAKILIFIVKYANLWGSSCRRRRGCLSSLLLDFALRLALKLAEGKKDGRKEAAVDSKKALKF